MGTLQIARKWVEVHGPTLDRYRSFVPRDLLAYWICAETAGDRLAVSTDKKLVEMGWPQAPIARAFRMNVDPFHTYGGLWCACLEALEDAAHWRAAGSDDLQRQKIGRWLERADSNLWWVIQMDYSIGTGALRWVLQRSIAWAEGKGRGPADRGLMTEAIDWGERTDLGSEQNRGHWGRQSPAIILKRLLKHRVWIVEAAKMGTLDDAAPGAEPTEQRPSNAPAFPPELIPNAKIAARNSSQEDLVASWREILAYRNRRRRREYAPKAPVVARIAAGTKALIRDAGDLIGVKPPETVRVERAVYSRDVVPW